MDVLSGSAPSQARGFSDSNDQCNSGSVVQEAQVLDPRVVHPWRYRLCGTTTKKPNSVRVTSTASGFGSISGESTATVPVTTTTPSDAAATESYTGISGMSSNTIVPSPTESIPTQSIPLVRPNPLKPPTDAEILFVLPSISLRITSDQRQTMAQPSLSSIPFIQIPATSTTNTATTTTTEVTETQTITKSESLASNAPVTTAPVPDDRAVKSSRTWLYGSRNLYATQDSPATSTNNRANPPSMVFLGPDVRQPFAPSVKISFQTDFHGFVQLGLIDVPWLPTLISSYLNERLQEYERKRIRPVIFLVTALVLT